MLRKLFDRLWLQAWSLILVELNGQEIGWLLQPQSHISLLGARRVAMIVSRVRLIAGLFAILTPLWIIIDILTFTPEIWHGLAASRITATVGFTAILLSLRRMESMGDAYRSLSFLLAVPTAFFIFSHQHLAVFQLSGVQAAFATGYAYLPFVMLAGLSIFPLTLTEALAFSAPMLGAQVVAAMLDLDVLNWPNFAASMWLLLLIAAVSMLAGLSQLAFMIVLVREAIRDNMTGCFSRHSGEELLELQFILATRSNSPLTVAFIDLDKFKSVNDSFGHDAGDKVLINAATTVRKQLRTGDMLARWGGEEFILIMPNTPLPNACIALERLRTNGFGLRPDGVPMTASIGVAERLADHPDSWRKLVEAADSRMYAAKQGGRNRVIGCESADSTGAD
jgi:diguanylate cyclase (GGDEF)-like protein